MRYRMVYYVIMNRLKKEEPINKIAKEIGITSETVYRIKKEFSLKK